MAHLDTCPLVHCRLVLKAATTSRPSTAMNLMSQVLKVLSRSENKRLFGKELEGSMPPQPVLTMIDHLMIHGCEVEGIMRKSPKQATVRLLKTQLDNGQVPDFHQFNAHVTASLLKEYLRSIPGQLLLSGNYHLWIEVCEEFNEARKMHLCKNLLKLLPQCHTVLLKSILRLLRKIASNEYITKMSINSLGVCIAPSLLENP
uniref:Rho-GAP domain-containing protein n=1 Tax=Panagrolaimus sp. ES5 TaxID=591445 RepID=A0AC34G6M0_9BILA